MLLPRPARVLRQYPQLTATRFVRTTATATVIKQQLVSPALDPSFGPLLKDVDLNVRRQHNKGPTSVESSLHQHLNHTTLSPLGTVGTGDVDVGEDAMEPREERRSPAAVLGSKRIGLIVPPERLSSAIQNEINATDPREVRRSFLSIITASQSRLKKEKLQNTPALSLARAAAFLPGEYAVVRNVLEEIGRRVGEDWLEEAGGDMVEVTSTLGAGLWAMLDARGLLEEGIEGETGRELGAYHMVHASRYGLELAEKLAQAIPKESVNVSFNRKFPSEDISSTPAVALSTFHLSSLPTVSARRTHLRQLLSLSSSYLILIDRSSPSGWAAISEAREYLLSLSDPENPLHAIAPCPHDAPCPLANGRDACGFSQRLQRPSFLRKTKHSGRGEEDIGYCYLVIRRGERPAAHLNELGMGRVGGAGKEAAEKARKKMQGKNFLREVEGGEFEMVSLAESESCASPSVHRVEAEEVDIEALRKEAYSWPRLVAPPLKRSGHVIMDTCSPNGLIQRLTFSKSHSKQGYHDARKASWGDLFPHEPKGKEVVRSRGVRRLSKPEAGDGMFGFTGNWPVAELVEEGDVEGLGLQEALEEELEGSTITTWKSGGKGEPGMIKRQRTVGQRREFSTTARRLSARPVERKAQVVDSATRPKVTINELYRMGADKIPITCLTAYDFPTALLSESAGVDMVLIGDSLSQVALGYNSTTSITLDEMIHHAKAVTRGAKTPFIFADLPFGSFEASVQTGVESVVRLVKEGGVDGVKIEGGREIIPLVKRLSAIGIPVIPHIGLQPQRATSLSGYLVQARTAEGAKELYETGRLMQEAGAFAVLLEAIPQSLARYITDHLDIITIGIGAGPGTSGQVLVITDVLGVYAGMDGAKPRFVRHFGNMAAEARKAVDGYVAEVKGGGFPEVGKETYGIKKEEWDRFLASCESGQSAATKQDDFSGGEKRPGDETEDGA